MNEPDPAQTSTPAGAQSGFGGSLPRDWRLALVRGLRGVCPACGRGRLFDRYLKPVEHCSACDEDLSHQRADDFPPYIVILLLGHILVPIAIELERNVSPPLWVYMSFGPMIAAILVLALLQPVKGGVIGFQWAHRMHGFDDAPQQDGCESPASIEQG